MERPGPSNDRATTPARSLNAPALWALSILVGVVAGLGAVAFRALIGFFHNLLFLGKLSVDVRREHSYAAQSMGPICHFRAGRRCAGRGVSGEKLRSGSQGSRGSGGDGCRLSSQGDHSPGGIGGQSSCFGTLHRQWCVDRPRRTHHSNRLLLWLDPRPVTEFTRMAADHPDRRGSRRRNRRDL